MDGENQEDDGDHREYCELCDKLCRKFFYKNQLQSPTHANNDRKNNS